MKKDWVRQKIADALGKTEAGFDAYRAFRSSLDWLPADQVTAFVAKHVVGETPIDLASHLRRLTPEIEPAVLAGLRARKTPSSIFFESLVAAGRTLREGVDALAKLSPPNVFADAKEKRDLKSLVARPEMVEAARAALHAEGDVTGFLALCIAEGSESSADAILPWVERARRGDAPHVLDMLEHLAPLAPRASVVRGILDVSSKAHEERTSRSSVTRFLKTRGWPIHYLYVDIDATEIVSGLPIASASLVLDAKSAEWATIYVSRSARQGRTKVKNLVLEEDALELGPLESIDEFPKWLARAAERLKVEWGWETLRHKSALRGKARAAVTDWLRNG